VLSKLFSQFLRDEGGGYTIWSLTWFMLYVALGGIAVDMSDAYRNQTMLQGTADAAALAGVMSLPDATDAVTQAVSYSTDNMDTGVNGYVLDADEVTIGTWDFATRSFTAGGATPNAVRTVTRRDGANANPLATAFLPILGVVGIDATRFNISVEAIAARNIPSCINDGMIALNRVDMRSNNDLLRLICIHGQNDGVDLQNHNYFEEGVRVSMPDLDMLPGRPNLYDMNPGLVPALVEGDLWPKDVALLPTIIGALQDLGEGYNENWPFMYQPDGKGGYTLPKKVTGSSLPATLQPYTVYDINCNGQIKLPKDVLIQNVVIVANCRIHAASDFSAGNVVIASTDTGGSASIDMAAKSNLGLEDDCAPGGGVELYTLGDVHLSAQGSWNGLRVVAGNDVKFTSNNSGIHGISVQAGNNIDFSSNNEFGLCIGNNPGPFAWHYALVQ